MASQRHLTWRIEGIPSHYEESDLKACFHSDDKKHVEIKSLAPDVINYDGTGTLTATVLFSGPGGKPRIEEHRDDLQLDKDFLGFTPLNNPTEDVCADIIAVTGLAGHAFGSWAHSSQKMWLRDYLPNDIQNRARVLIYGYESQIQGANTGKSIIADFGSSFIQNLMDLRNHSKCRDRPLILIGHSLGALIIKHAITDLEPTIRSRLPVRTVLFFGAPHNGLECKALETLVKGHPSETLVGELKYESPTLTGLAERFRFISKTLSIHSYFESRRTKTVTETDDGTWTRDGAALMMVERSSAILGLEREETRKQVDADHKDIAKLRRGQGGVYPNVLRIIKDALQSASEQFAAAARATEEKKLASDPFVPVTVEPPPDASDEQTSPYNESVIDQLYCEACEAQFPKTQAHFNCCICNDGFFNICTSCWKGGSTCGHELLKRRLGVPESPEDSWSDDEEEVDVDRPGISCDGCATVIPRDQEHFHCILCNDGNFDLCIACIRFGWVCPGRHIMIKRQLQVPIANGSSNSRLGTPNIPGSGQRSPSQQTPPKRPDGPNSALGEKQYCELEGCRCGLPNRPRAKSPLPPPRTWDSDEAGESGADNYLPNPSTSRYCDIPGCKCGLPNTPKPVIEYCDTEGCECGRPSRPKKIIEYCDVEGCQCGRPNRPKPVIEYCDTEGCECGRPSRPKEAVEYCDVEGCKCGRPNRPKEDKGTPKKGFIEYCMNHMRGKKKESEEY